MRNKLCFHQKPEHYRVKLYPVIGVVPQLPQLNYEGASGIATNMNFEELILYEIYKEELEKLNKYGNFKLGKSCWKAKMCFDCKVEFISNFKDTNYTFVVEWLHL